MLQNFKFQPDLINWQKEASGRYVSNDGLRKCEKLHNVWYSSIRKDWDSDWQVSKYVFGALHAAQDECRRMVKANA